MTPIERVLERLEGAKRSGDGWIAWCPAHPDREGKKRSLSVGVGRDGQVIFKCHARDCAVEAIAEGLGLVMADLWPDGASGGNRPSPRRRKPVIDEGSRPTGKTQWLRLTVAELAAAKGLDAAFLRSLGLRDADGKVVIPYRLADGRESPRARARALTVDAETGEVSKALFWTGPRGSGGIVPYGLDRLAAARDGGELVIVEGESDCWTLWQHGVAALGLPGASTSAKIEAEHLAGVARIYLVRERDLAGEDFASAVASRLVEIGWQGELRVVTLPGEAKDVSAAYLADPETFADGFWQAMATAATIALAELRSAGADPNDFALTDLGNGELFAALHGGTLRYDHARGRWLRWAGQWWTEDTDGEVYRLAKVTARRRYDAAWNETDKKKRARLAKHALRSENRARVEAMLAMGRNERPITTAGDQWDADPWLFGVANGVVDLRTGTLRDGRPDDWITQHSDVAFDAAAPCHEWEAFLEAIFLGSQDTIEFLWRAVGYSLTGDMREQCVFLLHGTGSNGKSVLLDVLRCIFGAYAVTVPFAAFEDQHRTRGEGPTPFLAMMRGARLVTASETSPSRRLDAQRVKTLTGDEAITARRLNENAITWTPTGKVWLSFNHRPRVIDDSHAFWRRIREIPFKARFLDATELAGRVALTPEGIGEPELAANEAPADNTLRERLKLEAPGILAWAVRGCLAWQGKMADVEKGLGKPEVIADAVEEYQRESDPLAEWRDACIDHDPNAGTSSSELYASYLAWCDREHIRDRERLSRTAFGRILGGRYDKQHRRTGSIYLGIGIRYPATAELFPPHPPSK